MADKKAEITNINLESGNLNLDDEQIQITAYEGYNKKNSLYLGGQLKNWYKKDFDIPLSDFNGAVIQKWRDSVIWQDGEGNVYKDNDIIGSFETKGFRVEDVNKPWIEVHNTTEEPSSIDSVSFNVQGNRIDLKWKKDGVDYSYGITTEGLNSLGIFYGNKIYGDTIYVTIYSRTSFVSMYYDFERNVMLKDENFVILSNSFVEDPVLFTRDGRVSYDCVCLTEDLETEHTYQSATTRDSFEFQKIYDSTEKGWSRGRKIPLAEGSNFYALYYNFEQTGISYGNSIAVNNIDSILYIDTEAIYFKDSENKLKKLSVVDTPFLECQPIVKDRFLLLNTTSYNNTIDLVNGNVFCRSDDYNDRCRIEMLEVDSESSENSENEEDDKSTYVYCVTSWNEQVETKQFVNFASVYPARAQKGRIVKSVKTYLPDEEMVHDINIYVDREKTIGSPIYYKTYDFELDQMKTDFTLDGYYFPINNNMLSNVSVIAKFTDIYLNYALVDEGGYSFITQIDQYQNMIFGYYSLTYIQLSNLFVLQGTIYGINNQYVVGLTISNNTITGVQVVCNKSDMQYIGSTPKTALFYSPMDKSVYLFQGDQSMVKAYDCNKVNKIYSFYNNPATGFIMLATDVGIICIYNDQVMSLEDVQYDGNLYYTNNNYVIGNTEYSPYKKEGFEVVPVILETKYYGVSNGIKSVNDCVYIRIFSENKEASGTVKVWSSTLNESSVKSPEKVFYIDKSMFDKETQSLYLRYQPKYQECTGFRVHIESDFSICSVSISHKAETVQNAKYNI